LFFKIHRTEYRIFYHENKPFVEGDRTVKAVVFGGTFNPPHIGHLRMAEQVIYAHGMERVIFVPAHTPPHKSTEKIARPGHRLSMTQICCRDNDRFQVSDLEIRAGGPSYTVNTLEKLRDTFGKDLRFLMGSDSLAEIRTWKEYERLFDLSNFIVISRPGISFEKAWADLPQSIRGLYRETGDGYERLDMDQQITRSPITGLDISATLIRSLIRDNISPRYLVTDEVLAYIQNNGLYNK
jgi:nicotinate-nucleotide adenylyltransferase